MSLVAAAFIATPTPGWMTFTNTRPTTNARVVRISKYTIALAPMRPIALMSPAPAMPCTSVAKISGAMIDLIIRRKTLLKMAIPCPASGKNWPTRIPATRPMTIQLVNEIRFKTPISSGSPL